MPQVCPQLQRAPVQTGLTATTATPAADQLGKRGEEGRLLAESCPRWLEVQVFALVGVGRNTNHQPSLPPHPAMCLVLELRSCSVWMWVLQVCGTWVRKLIVACLDVVEHMQDRLGERFPSVLDPCSVLEQYGPKQESVPMHTG